MRYKNRSLCGDFISHKISKIFFGVSFSMFIAMAGITPDSPKFLVFTLNYLTLPFLILSAGLFFWPYKDWTVGRVWAYPYEAIIRKDLVLEWRFLISIKNAPSLFLWLAQGTQFIEQFYNTCASHKYENKKLGMYRALLDYGAWDDNRVPRALYIYKKVAFMKYERFLVDELKPSGDENSGDQAWQSAEFYVDIFSMLYFIEDMEGQYMNSVYIRK